MPSSGMLRRVALVRTDVSDECSSPIIKVIGIVAISPILVTLMTGTLRSSD
jgi:hypothetical protein